MPTYEYECDNCGERFDIFQSIKDDPATVCEKCGGHLTKLLSAGSGLIFKGSGFYITDYKNSKGSGAASGSSSDAGSSSKESSAGGGNGKEAGVSSESSSAKTSEKSGSGDKSSAAGSKAEK